MLLLFAPSPLLTPERDGTLSLYVLKASTSDRPSVESTEETLVATTEVVILLVIVEVEEEETDPIPGTYTSTANAPVNITATRTMVSAPSLSIFSCTYGAMHPGMIITYGVERREPDV